MIFIAENNIAKIHFSFLYRDLQFEKLLEVTVTGSNLGMHRISGRITRPFLISSIRSDTEFDSPDIRPDTGYLK
jgi:hypothetical protein